MSVSKLTGKLEHEMILEPVAENVGSLRLFPFVGSPSQRLLLIGGILERLQAVVLGAEVEQLAVGMVRGSGTGG